MHPSRTVELELSTDAAFDRCRYGIERVLGGFVREERRTEGTLEATFGLIYSDRLTCTLAAIDGTRTRVIIETRRGAQAPNSAPAPYINALAEYLIS